MTDAELFAWRAEFPILAEKVYLNSCSLGATSLRSRRYLESYWRLWAKRGTPAWETWFAELRAMKGLLARLLGAGAHEVALSPSVSTALSTVASCLDHARRKTVVLSELDFPTGAHQWLAKARDGIRVRFVRSDDGVTVPAERFAGAVDDDTALVLTSHVYFLTGYIQDIRRVTEIAHAAGALCCIDGYHAVGALPVDVKAAGVDFYTGGVLKWLCGGPGLAYLYVREDLIPRLEPRITGWLATADPFAFESGRLEFAPDATRFEFGTPAVPSVYAARGGVEIILEVGADAIRARQRRLTRHFLDRARAAGFEFASPDDDERRGGVVMVRLDHPAEVAARLIAEGYVIDHRPGRIRVSPHFYNTEEELDRFLAALVRIAREVRGRLPAAGAGRG